MNKVFAKSKELVLDEKYKIIPDSDNGVVLVFLTEKENKKKEIVPFEEKYHYPRIAQALEKYINLSLSVDNTILEILVNSKRVLQIIRSIDETFKQF